MWKCSDEPPCQVGQLLYYLLAAQLRRVQLFLSSSTHGEPTPLLGIFMEEDKVYMVMHARVIPMPAWAVNLILAIQSSRY